MGHYRCLLCDAGNPVLVSNRDAKTGEALLVVRCVGCGFVSQMEPPCRDDLKIYYSHNYRVDYKSVVEPKLKHVYRAGAAAAKRLAFLQTSGVTIAGKSLVDIGAGGGEFIFLATKAGGLAKGIEPNAGYSEFAKREYGVEVNKAMLDEANLMDVDVITMFHVLEHMANPKAVFEQLWGFLNSDGYLLIEVPNILQKDASPNNIFFKAHLHYFSVSTLKAFASPWFSCEKVSDDGNLLMLLKKREEVSTLNLPNSSEVQHVERRLKAKGWLEYLFVGGGLLKLFKKLKARSLEAQLKGSPKQLLLRKFVSGDLDCGAER